MQTELQTNPGLPLPISLSKFCESMGITPATAWRWRKRGILRTSNIAGRQYLSPAALDEFYSRLEAGDFAKEAKVPKPAASESRAKTSALSFL